MASEVTLTAAMRNNLTSLQKTADQLNSTQTRLSTGRKVNTALDNPINFFSAAAHTQRANQLDSRKDGMNEAIQTIKAADAGVTGLQSLIAAAKGILETARSTAQSGLAALYSQFNTVNDQINQLIKDSGYKGSNFLNGSSVSLDVLFNETGTNKLTLNGFDATITGVLSAGQLTGYTAISAYTDISAAGGFSNASVINLVAAALTDAVGQYQVQSSKLASNLAVVNARLDFTNSVINVEKTGADNLTLADTNEEGANMLMLNTRNSLGTTSLSLASQAAQSVLRLF